MNLILLRAGYPPVAVRPADRGAYITSLEEAQVTNDPAAYRELLTGRLHATLLDYLAVVRESLSD